MLLEIEDIRKQQMIEEDLQFNLLEQIDQVEREVHETAPQLHTMSYSID